MTNSKTIVRPQGSVAFKNISGLPQIRVLFEVALKDSKETWPLTDFVKNKTLKVLKLEPLTSLIQKQPDGQKDCS